MRPTTGATYKPEGTSSEHGTKRTTVEEGQDDHERSHTTSAPPTGTRDDPGTERTINAPTDGIGTNRGTNRRDDGRTIRTEDDHHTRRATNTTAFEGNYAHRIGRVIDAPTDGATTIGTTAEHHSARTIDTATTGINGYNDPDQPSSAPATGTRDDRTTTQTTNGGSNEVGGRRTTTPEADEGPTTADGKRRTNQATNAMAVGTNRTRYTEQTFNVPTGMTDADRDATKNDRYVTTDAVETTRATR